jgi:hypothetical protein
MRNILDKVVEKMKTHILCSINFLPRKSCHLCDNVEKSGRDRQARNYIYNSAHALCVLDTQGYKHTLTICNTYRFYTATMVTRMHHASRQPTEPAWQILIACVQCWDTPDDGQWICPKHVEYFIKEIWKRVHLVGFHYKNISRWKVLWMSN